MKMYIPELQDVIELTEDWTFKLYYERRNVKLFEYLKLDKKSDKNIYWFQRKTEEPIDVTLPKGTQLVIDRIYIRSGCKNFSSVTFKLGQKRGVRFWAKLQDVNTMDMTQVITEENKPTKTEKPFSILRHRNHIAIQYKSGTGKQTGFQVIQFLRSSNGHHWNDRIEYQYGDIRFFNTLSRTGEYETNYESLEKLEAGGKRLKLDGSLIEVFVRWYNILSAECRDISGSEYYNVFLTNIDVN